ncbi:hypothetical protein ACRRTK_019737 [Alexandromys fortis]
MGLGHSKHQSRVIKVTPLQSQEAETPSAGPVFYALNRNLEEKNSYPFSRLQDQNPALERQLPPLRETWYGRHPAVSRSMCLDIPLKHEESSIIKRHPPRRIQKLDPIDLPQVITSEQLLRQPEARTGHKAEDEELLDDHRKNDYCVRKIGKMEAWLREQDTQGRLFWSSSSYDSDEFEKDQKRPQALVRTRTERIPLYDEFYDRE